ncbi:MAG: HD domain-containing protein [Desulfovibrio sp.]|nr:HD domain-containing protein [Desulfovibrio sp.]
MAYAADRCAVESASPNGDIGPMSLKIRHSMGVLHNARRIVDSEDFSAAQGRVCLLAALYHDVGRFEQYLRFHMFKDKESCNHGQLGVRILKQKKRLQGEDAPIRKAVLAAVALHNRFALPQGLPEHMAIAAHVVRDADKLDILRVMDEHLSGPGPYNPTVVLSLPDDANLHSDAVIQAAREERVAAYADLRSVNDFRLLLGTWFFDMHFDSSRRQFVEDGHARNLLRGLPDVSPYKAVAQTLLEKLGALRGASC